MAFFCDLTTLWTVRSPYTSPLDSTPLSRGLREAGAGPEEDSTGSPTRFVRRVSGRTFLSIVFGGSGRDSLSVGKGAQ
jgi:hypothetical protein